MTKIQARLPKRAHPGKASGSVSGSGPVEKVEVEEEEEGEEWDRIHNAILRFIASNDNYMIMDADLGAHQVCVCVCVCG